MNDATGEAGGAGLRVAFDRRLKLEFHGASVTSDAGLLTFRELDDALGLTVMAAEVFADTRTGRNGRHSLIAQLRQSVFGRLAGYEDVNDADRLGRDPAMRWIVGGRAVTEQAASTSQMGRFETSAMTEERNLTALADLSGHWIDRIQPRRARTALVLDIDSSVIPTYGAQEGTAYTATSSALATIRCSSSTRTATWSDAHFVRATCIARTTGGRCWTRWWRGIVAGASGACCAAMRPSRCRTCTSI
jgi:Transposase DDE domain group 1